MATCGKVFMDWRKPLPTGFWHLDAAGFQRVIVETVGVGQAEVDIAGTTHTTVVVEAPGLGDEVQAIKAGVLEIADILVVNKADREGADKTMTALHMMLGMGMRYAIITGARWRWMASRRLSLPAGPRPLSRQLPCATPELMNCWRRWKHTGPIFLKAVKCNREEDRAIPASFTFCRPAYCDGLTVGFRRSPPPVSG